MKITRQHLCTLATITYHLLFLGGARYYVVEFQKTRETIVRQVDRVENEAKKIHETGEEVQTSIKSVKIKLDQVEKVCSKLRF